ncbi:FtsX-like permease family protein [Staphylococcus felis]|uniref:ABC transporter permease n=1 Tax=Staphylococcus felis TaxID=46127 RepID=UPI003967D6B9
MKYYQIFKDVLKLLKRNKRQSILTSIAIGIATFVVLIILSSQSYTFNALSEDMKIDEHTTSLTFTPHDKLDLEGFTDEDSQIIQKQTGYHPKLISSSYGKMIPVKLNGNQQILSFRTEHNLKENHVELPEVLKGKDIHHIQNVGQVAISDKALMKLTRSNDIENGLDKVLTIDQRQYKIKTIYQSSAVKEVIPDMIISPKSEKAILKNHVFYDEMEVSTSKTSDIYKMLAILDQKGTHRERETYDFIDNVQTYKDTKKEANTILNFIAILSSISIFVAGFGVMNAMFSTVSERSREIAIRRALGAKKSHIYLSYMIEGTLLSIMGGIMGAISAFIFIALMNLSGLDSAVSTIQVLITLAATAILGVLFSMLPAMVAANKNVVEGMK